MSNRSAISVLVSMIVSAVLFGIGAVTVLSMPSLSRHAATLLPFVVVASIVLSPIIAWYIAPQLRARPLRTALREDPARKTMRRL